MMISNWRNTLTVSMVYIKNISALQGSMTFILIHLEYDEADGYCTATCAVHPLPQLRS